jgi:hypothetical protein
MRKFVRQKQQLNNSVANVSIDFGAAESKIARVFEPGDYRLRIDAARVVQNKENISVALDLTELDANARVDGRPLWVDGPNSGSGNLTAENQHLIAQLLTLAKLPTSGNVGELIPKLAGLEFEARMVLSVDNKTGRSFNAIADIFTDDDEAA